MISTYVEIVLFVFKRFVYVKKVGLSYCGCCVMMAHTIKALIFINPSGLDNFDTVVRQETLL
jgi:hypothetical protein